MRHYPDIPLEKVRGGRATWWRVAEPVACQDHDGSVYVIPAGFVSNLASMPRWVYPFIRPHGLSAIPSVKHDYRYIHLVGMERLGYARARAAADDQYRLDLRAEGLPAAAALLMWAGVRTLGWWWWNGHIRRRLKEIYTARACDV